jgi:AcrR family transcriptional regulator
MARAAVHPHHAGRGPAPRRRSSWRKDPAGRRARVLSAAAELFGTSGYKGVRTEEIARSAGVSEGIVYHYFGTKEGLLRAVAERYGRGFARAMFEGLSRDGDVPAVEAVMRRAFAYVRFSDPLFGVFLLNDEIASSRGAKQANREEIVSSLAGFLESWSARGLVRSVAPRITATLLFGLVEAALKDCFVHGGGANEDAYVTEVVQAINGILSIRR